MLTRLPTVVSLTRFPVKSLLGEPVDELHVDTRGCTGDRLWSVRTAENKIGSGKSTRRFTAVDGLLQVRSRTADGRVEVMFPDGRTVPVDEPEAAQRLSEHVGAPLHFARETDVSHFDDGPVSVVCDASVDALTAAVGRPVDVRRFRANIVLHADHAHAEQGWVGRAVRIGDAVLRVQMRSPRCVMINVATAELPAQPGNLKTLTRLNDGTLGVVAQVLQPGTIRLGDTAVALDT